MVEVVSMNRVELIEKFASSIVERVRQVVKLKVQDSWMKSFIECFEIPRLERQELKDYVCNIMLTPDEQQEQMFRGSLKTGRGSIAFRHSKGFGAVDDIELQLAILDLIDNPNENPGRLGKAIARRLKGKWKTKVLVKL